jgi:hypothetical protein
MCEKEFTLSIVYRLRLSPGLATLLSKLLTTVGVFTSSNELDLQIHACVNSSFLGYISRSE